MDETTELLHKFLPGPGPIPEVNVCAKNWIAPSESVDDIEHGKERAEAHAKAYLKKATDMELPRLEWKKSRSA